jgi:hypothetical protein
METLLFLTLGLLCLWLYSRESWIFLGISLGLLTLTRIEGISLAGIVLLIEFLRSRRINSALVKILTPLLLILIPWLIYLQIREGIPISTSFQGRQFIVSEVDERITYQFPAFSWVQKIHPLVHFVCWAYFTLIFITGSVSLPGPVIDLGGNLAGTELTLPIAAIAISAFCLPMTTLALKHWFKKLKPVSLKEPRKRLQIAILSWLFIFNLAYALFLPRVGAAGRYIPMNHMIFWISLLIGSTLIQNQSFKRIALILSVILFVVNINYWRTVYQANIKYLVNVRKQAANFIDQEYPTNVPIGATDLGVLGYYSNHPVVDLFGHINKDFNQFLSEGGDTPGYIAEKHLCYLMLFDSLDNAGLDIAQEMGLSNDSRFDLVIEKSFSVPVDEWSLGNGPIRNYMPVIKVYRVIWKDATACAKYLDD